MRELGMNTAHHELVLLRHGKAEKQYHGSDFERDLTETGCDRTKSVANYMREQQLLPDIIISSSAKRAIATTNIVCDIFSINTNMIKIRTDLYDAESDDVLTIIQQLPETVMRVLLVGHNPALEVLAEQLVSNSAEDIHLSPSSMARLAFTRRWSDLATGQCRLLSIMHAQELV
jgi:phosphohistidine phosphatase